MPSASDPPPQLPDAIARCRAEPAFLAQLGEIYEQVDAALAEAGVTCNACGRCCRFDLMAHRLYASAGEIAYLLTAEPPADAAEAPRCLYHVEPACLARETRPLGCRCYGCDPPASAEAGRDIYERFHQQIRRLHETFAVPYLYVEITTALVALTDTSQ